MATRSGSNKLSYLNNKQLPWQPNFKYWASKFTQLQTLIHATNNSLHAHLSSHWLQDKLTTPTPGETQYITIRYTHSSL